MNVIVIKRVYQSQPFKNSQGFKDSFIYEIVFLYYQAINGFVLTKLKRMLENDNNVRITSNGLMIELDKLVDDLHLDFRGKDTLIDPYIGKIFNKKYEVVKKLGEGSFGSVYQVNESIEDNKMVSKAIKIMKSDEELKQS